MLRFGTSLAVLVLAACPPVVCAHAVGVSCELRNGQVEVEAYYDDDTPAIQAKVRVFNSRHEVIATGVADDKGRWTFAKPAPGNYEVQLDAGAGHRAVTTLIVPGSAAPQAALAPASSGTSATRAQFTRFPWENMLIGLAVIALGGGGLALLLRGRASKHAAERQM